jgi:Zn-dependent peptidase ImmA (M78 family)
MTTKKAKDAARDILERFGADPPIDVRAIVEALGISVHEEKMEGVISGILMIKEKRNDLLINESHPPYRQRFTRPLAKVTLTECKSQCFSG